MSEPIPIPPTRCRDRKIAVAVAVLRPHWMITSAMAEGCDLGPGAGEV